jgi:DNA processing protein
MDIPYTPEQLLGPLNELERRNAPERLFVRGHLEWLKSAVRVSLVGARQASEEGVRRTTRLARALLERDVVVVSGLAAGIDVAAHRAAIDAGGRTIAVLGTPLEDVYPKAHAQLQAAIGVDHLLVSQFPPGTRTQRHHFPLRNRTMALIVHASVIVEAGESSGSLSQGWEALRLGRPLLLLRSLVDRTDLKWPQTMLDYGAQVLDSPDDLFALLPSRASDDDLAAIA